MTSIIGAGLGDKEIILAFAKIINHMLESQDLSKKFPLSARNLMKELHKHDPIQENLNAVSLSCKPPLSINDFGYV